MDVSLSSQIKKKTNTPCSGFNSAAPLDQNIRNVFISSATFVSGDGALERVLS